MANARQESSARTVLLASQQILQASINEVWDATDHTGKGLGANALLQRKLNVSRYVADGILDALVFLQLMVKTDSRGMGAFYYVLTPNRPVITQAATRRVLNEAGSAQVVLKAV